MLVAPSGFFDALVLALLPDAPGHWWISTVPGVAVLESWGLRFLRFLQ